MDAAVTEPSPMAKASDESPRENFDDEGDSMSQSAGR